MFFAETDENLLWDLRHMNMTYFRLFGTPGNLSLLCRKIKAIRAYNKNKRCSNRPLKKGFQFQLSIQMVPAASACLMRIFSPSTVTNLPAVAVSGMMPCKYHLDPKST